MNLRLAALTALALAACVPGEIPATAPGQPALTTSGMPGQNVADTATIANLFAKVCGETAPSFLQAPMLLASMPFALNTKTNVFIHRNLNLSFKISPKECSMVYRSATLRTDMAIAKALGTRMALIDGETGVSVSPGPNGTTLFMGPMGQSYHRAILETQ